MESPIQEKVLHWLANGRVGVSSKAMAMAIVGIKQEPHKISTPSDPDDLNRCLLFLEVVPEARSHFNKIAELSPQWKKLIEHWQEVEQCFLEEAGLDWITSHSAPKTYKLMKALGC